ncbi:MAG: carboxyl transferase domain-containing protein, partial [Candidatus Bipolaricaulia bacterium]
MAQKAIEQLEERIEELKSLSSESDIDLSDEIVRLEAKLKQMRREKPQVRESGSGSDDDWARVKLARHPKRPYTRDYIDAITDDFYELRGDRLYGEDRAIIGGMARFQGQTVVVVGHQKGRTTQENQRRNFGMAHPEGYRKVLRILKLAERFGFPVFSFIDTPGAYPGAGAEERNIGGALAINIYEMFTIRVPIIVTVIGEGGSGGAIGIGVGDRVLMLENAIYS